MNMDELLKKNVKEFIIGFFVFLIISIIVCYFKFTHQILTIILIVLGSYIIIGITYLILSYIKGTKNYYKKLKNNKTAIRFKYIDTFYFSVSDSNHETRAVVDIVFHILEDINNKKLYAMRDQNKTNIFLFNNHVYRCEGLKKQMVNINDEGNMWIHEEENDVYKRLNDDITILNTKVYYDDSKKVKGANKIKNINPQNDVSILDKVTFVYGLAEIDKKDDI